MKPILFIVTLLLYLSLSAEESLFNIPLKDINNKAVSLKVHKGKVLLVVNVASKCGLTPQYNQLQDVYKKYGDKGFPVCAFPCNQFGQQEPGSSSEIQQFCRVNYGVTFQIFEKVLLKFHLLKIHLLKD